MLSILILLVSFQFVCGTTTTTTPGQRFGHSITTDDDGNLILFGGTFVMSTTLREIFDRRRFLSAPRLHVRQFRFHEKVSNMGLHKWIEK